MPQPSDPPRRLPPRRAILAARLALGLVLALALSSCLSMPKMLGGSDDAVLVLDGEQGHEVRLPKGAALTLDMRDPGLSGYSFAGASFDPDLLRLDGITPPTSGRVRYMFSAKAKGESDIQIKIKKSEPGYRPDAYKLVHVIIE